jgi:hypothetical protein
MLAEGFFFKSCGNVGVGLGKCERHAVGHTQILWYFGGSGKAKMGIGNPQLSVFRISTAI